jgi:MFS family permease
MSTISPKQEWSAHWPIPFIGMLGIAGVTTLGFSSGVFMQAMTAEFGWTRGQFSFAFTLQVVVGLILGPMVGRFVDRFGPRRIALVGLVAFVPSVSMLGLANGVMWQWWVLGAIQAACAVMIGPSTWIAAIVPRFNAARGMAMAVALAGVGVGTAIWPILAAHFVQTIGWRLTFPVLALCCSGVMLPLTFFFFTNAGGASAPAARLPESRKTASTDYWRAVRSRNFICITLAGGLYASMSFAMVLHCVPLLQSGGLSLTTAARLAGIAGICSAIGRLCTGFLLDRMRTLPIAVIVFLMPIAVSLLFRLGGGSTQVELLAVILLGLSAGAETDVVFYTASRRFGRHIIASVLATITALLAVLAAMGPLLASVLFDVTKSYDLFLTIVIPVILVATLFMGLVLLSDSGRQADPQKE